MNQSPAQGKKGANFASVEAGPMTGLAVYSMDHPSGREVSGKLFLKEALGLTGMEISLNKLPARAFVPFFHRHRENEEVYLFLKGKGEFMVDGEIIPVTEGTCIRVAPGGIRTWRNHSHEDLYYVVIQAKAGSMPQGTISDGEPVEGRVRWRKSPAE